MHDRKLLSDHERESAEPAGHVPAMPSAKRAVSRTNFLAIIGFCVVGLICSLLVPASYLHMEQTSALLAQFPLS